MADREIIWTKTAQKQRRSVLEYWVERTGSTDYSIKLISLVSKRTSYIAEHSEFGKISEYPDTRVTSLGHFSIFYKVEKSNIIITAFWDNRQDPDELYNLLTQ
jgi:hypothetical protein